MAFEFLHAADLHLDSPLRGLRRYEGAPIEAVREASRRATENMVRSAIDSRVAFVVIAGDVYDGEWPDFNTGLFFVKQMSRLRAAGIPVFVVQGNHDAVSVISRSVPLPDNVTVFAAAGAETRVLDDLGVALHGRSFAKRSVEENLALGYPPALPGHCNIGILHTSADGREGHDRYAPCSVADMRAKGYDYWALGHIHKPEVLSRDPWIVFPGCIQGRHVGESGPRGCWRVTVDDEGTVAGAVMEPMDVLRWEVVRIAAGDGGEGEAAPDEVRAPVGDAAQSGHAASIPRIGVPGDFIEAVVAAGRESVDRSDGRTMALRIEVTGATVFHPHLVRSSDRLEAEARAAVIAEFGGQVWLEKVRWCTRLPASDGGVLAEAGFDAGFSASIEPALDALLAGGDAELEALSGRLGTVGLPGWMGADESEEEIRARLSSEVEAILLNAMQEVGGDGAGDEGAPPHE